MCVPVPFEDKYSLLPKNKQEKFNDYVNADKQSRMEYKEQSKLITHDKSYKSATYDYII